MPFGFLIVDIAVSHHFLTPHHHPPTISIGMLVVLATLVNIYLKWQADQLAMYPFNSYNWYIDRV